MSLYTLIDSHANLKKADTMKQVQSADNKWQPLKSLLGMMTYFVSCMQKVQDILMYHLTPGGSDQERFVVQLDLHT